MTEEREIEMFVAGLVLDPASNAPIVILKDAQGERCLPIWIGLSEATSIASAVKKVQLARPLTHDLLSTIIQDLGATVVRIVISDLRENTFIASLELRIGDQLKIIDCRPSDAIALAVRVQAAIYVSAEVLARAQVTLVAMNPDDPNSLDIPGMVSDTNFATIEKDKWSEILADMDPDDFKYKM